MSHLLTVTTFLPLVGLVVLVVGGRALKDDAARATALVTTLATFVVSLAILGRFDPAQPGFQLVERAAWVPSVGLQYLVGIDGISIWMVLLTTFLFPVAIARLAGGSRRTSACTWARCSLLETAVIGTFLALDLLLFFLFFEAMLVPMYLLIGGWGGERRIYAAVKFFLYTMAGLGVPAGRDPVPVLAGRAPCSAAGTLRPPRARRGGRHAAGGHGALAVPRRSSSPSR